MMEALVIGIITILVSVILSMAGFWLTVSPKYVTKEDVDRMLTVYHQPFIERQNLTDYRLNEAHVNASKMMDLIEKSNDAINALNLEVAKLSHVLATLESKLS